MTIANLKKLNEEILDATLTYQAKRLNLKEKEGKLLLETDFETVLNKKRPTVGEKEAYVFEQVKNDKLLVEECYAKLVKLQNDFVIGKMEVKFTGNFLTEVVQGVELDDD